MLMLLAVAVGGVCLAIVANTSACTIIVIDDPVHKHPARNCHRAGKRAFRHADAIDVVGGLLPYGGELLREELEGCEGVELGVGGSSPIIDAMLSIENDESGEPLYK